MNLTPLVIRVFMLNTKVGHFFFYLRGTLTAKVALSESISNSESSVCLTAKWADSNVFMLNTKVDHFFFYCQKHLTAKVALSESIPNSESSVCLTLKWADYAQLKRH